jgi:UDP-N-acetylmuramoyl-L-alanyl-D-glutamate--2,6-diaminopimelate ligase
MGKIAYDNSDIIVITSDNPRKEQPEEIIAQIVSGLPENINSNKTIYKIADRKAAILNALKAAESGDSVVIAGKGHETGQYFADRTLPFDDREVARSFFNTETHEN